MTKQNISLTKPNDDWPKGMVDNQESACEGEIMNDLIRQAREINAI